MRLKPKRKNDSKTLPKRSPFRLALPLSFGLLVAGVGVTTAELVRSMPEKRAVIQCKDYEKELTDKQARNSKPPRNCSKKLCKWKIKDMKGKKFYDCEPFDEAGLEENKKPRMEVAVPAAGMVGLASLALLIIYSSILRKKEKKKIKENRKNSDA